MTRAIIVSTTVARREDAQRIAQRLVESNLAACVQILGPMESHYYWKDEVQQDEEWLCLIKSRLELYDDLEKELLECHPYDEPQIIATEIVRGSGGYLSWLADQTTRPEQ